MSKKIYAVQIGNAPGIYKTWDEAEKQIKGFSGAIFKSFKDSELDLAKKYLDGDISIVSKSSKLSFYCVLNGHKPGVYKTWDETKEQIDGFNNAKFKKFSNEKDAIESFEKKNLDIISDRIEKKFKKELDIAIFTDGGANKDGVGGYAYIILFIENLEIVNKIEYAEGYEKTTNNEMEMTAVYSALSYLEDQNIANKKIGFFIDSLFTIKSMENKYDQVANKDIGILLYNSYDTINDKNRLSLTHINSHIGIKYNEEVDKLLGKEKEKIILNLENERIVSEYSDM